MTSIAKLEPCAAGHLATYCSRASRYAWPAYDVDTDRTRLQPVDVLAPTLLSYPLRAATLQAMFQRPDGNDLTHEAALYEAMEACVTDPTARSRPFDDLDDAELGDPSAPGWGMVLRALDAVQPCPRLSSVAVTKILHRKLPHLVPINDSRVREFYGVRHSYSALFAVVKTEIQGNAALLDGIRRSYELEDGTTMSRLRALDIVVWMHQQDPTCNSIR